MYISGKTLLLQLLILQGLLMGCNTKNNGKLDLEKPSFQTYDDTEMFFKNVRQIYYELENQENTQLKLYRLKKQNQSTQARPILNLALVHNWRYDEAYLLLEPNDFFENPRQISLQWTLPQEKSTGLIQLKSGSKEAMLVFAYQIYQRLLLNCDLALEQAGKKHPFLADKQEREAFRVSVADYLRLIQTK